MTGIIRIRNCGWWWDGRIAKLFLAYNPEYKYPREGPEVTDFGRQSPEGAGRVGFLEFSALK